MRRPIRLALLLVLAACYEQPTAPGVCPDFCPGGQITVVDSIFTDLIQRDSAFTGYVEGFQGEALQVTDLPGVVDSRAILRMNAMYTRITNRATDTTTYPITVDSARLRINIVRRDTNATNLWVKVYRLPIDIDTTTTFAQLVPAFSDSIVDSVNLSALLATPLISDTATVRVWGDPIRTDSAGHILQIGKADSTLLLFFALDTAQARFVVADSGKVAYGVRVSGDSLATIALGSLESNRGADMEWFFTYPDTTGAPKDSTAHRAARFDSFVFNPPTPPLDSNLAVGGVPAARSLLRFAIPEVLRDSADVVRATLVLVPVGPVPGVVGDSFRVVVRPVVTDLGAKSPLAVNSPYTTSKIMHVNDADTVRIELTDLVRAWAQDTSAATALVLGQAPEAATYTQVRFYSSRAPAFRPALHITFVRRYPFGTP